MPFGLIFGAVVFFVLLSVVFGLLWLPGGGINSVGGVFLVVLGVTLSLGLLRRQSVARWTGVVTAALLAVVGVRNVLAAGGVLSHLVLLAGLMTFVLLLVPATGDVRRGLPEGSSGVKRRGNALGWTSVAALVGFVCIFIWTLASYQETAARVPETPVALEWSDFAPGLEKAKAQGKPIFIDFFADWCVPCHVMDRKTFHDPEVTRRLAGLVAVRVNSEETEPRHGVTGVELTERYRVQGYPTVMILDSEGREVARKSGNLPPRVLLAWLDRALRKLDEPRAASPEEPDITL